jgi:YHS domain-containing protein
MSSIRNGWGQASACHRSNTVPTWVLLPVLLITIAAAFVMAGTIAAGAGEAKINTIGSGKAAIRGYDPVAYFRAGGPEKGKAEFSHEHGGATWHFASAENKALFAANPGKYMPAYGGYCAYGVAKGGLYKIEPDAWSIRDGRLYLNYDKRVQATWSKKPDSYIRTADRKWTGLSAK